MAYPIVRIDPTTAGKERSPALWRNLLEKYDIDPSLGTFYSNTFRTPRTNTTAASANNGWFLDEEGTAGATGEGFTTNTDPDGVVDLVATTDDLEGVKAHAGESVSQGENIPLSTHRTAASVRGTVVFEAQVYLDLSANDTMFVGLAEPQDIWDDDNTFSDDIDYVGFYRLDAGDLEFVVRSDNNAGTATETTVNVVAAADITEDDWVKLGFRVNDNQTIEIFIDGVLVPATSDSGNALISITVANLPVDSLTRTLAVARGTTANNATVSLPCRQIEAYVAE